MTTPVVTELKRLSPHAARPVAVAAPAQRSQAAARRPNAAPAPATANTIGSRHL
jgi:hypothetical protein